MKRKYYERKCGLCGKPYIVTMPPDQPGRLICISDGCIDRYEKAAKEIAQEESEAEKKAQRERRERAQEALRKSREDRDTGYVYLMRAENGLYKIGRAINIKVRLDSLNREIPIKVEVLHYFKCKDYAACEAKLHEEHKQHRVKYEWFSLPESVVERIISIPDFGLE